MTLDPRVADQLAQTLTVLHRHLEGRIVAIHLFGSAVQGGLQPGSDLDLLVTATDAPPKSVRHALQRELLTISAPPRTSDHWRPLEVTLLARDQVLPWRYAPRRELQFGEWLRADLEGGIFEDPVRDPDLALLLTQARLYGRALEGPAPVELFEPIPHDHVVQAMRDTISQWDGPHDWAGDGRTVVLALARCAFTAATGRIASKTEAAAWLMERLPEPESALLTRALDAYLGRALDDLCKDQQAMARFVRKVRPLIEVSLDASRNTPATSANSELLTGR